jgi:c-di-GMP-binding flagellar brake protein YcgR
MERTIVERRHARHPIRVPVYVSVQGDTYRKLIPIQSRDISAGGIGFETSRNLPLRSTSQLVLSRIGDLPRAAMIEGRVVHSNQNPITGRYSVGVEFTRFIQVSQDQLLESITAWEARSH